MMLMHTRTHAHTHTRTHTHTHRLKISETPPQPLFPERASSSSVVTTLVIVLLCKRVQSRRADESKILHSLYDQYIVRPQIFVFLLKNTMNVCVYIVCFILFVCEQLIDPYYDDLVFVIIIVLLLLVLLSLLYIK